MPFKTAKAKIERNREWRRGRSPGYYKWLYARRKVRFDKADVYEDALRKIGHLTGNTEARRVAYAALDAMSKRERAVGNEYDHGLDQGVWVE